MSDEHSALELIGWLNAAEQKFVPKSLFAVGDLRLLRGAPRVSVVGSREATQAGLDKAAIVAKAIVDRGGVVVSGLARGVDTAAHRTAIAAGGRTMAVIGTPLDTSYPAENRSLQAEIMRNHLVLSQFPGGYPFQKKNFVMRNRTMALVSQATIIVEAKEKSGTEHQGWEAIRLGRLLLLPRALVEAGFEWPRKMCAYGALPFESKATLEALLDEYLPAVSAEELIEFPF